MSFNGAGVFNRLYSWVQDAINGIKIRADRMDADTNGIATGLTDCVTRDGQSPWLANLPAGGFRVTGAQDGQNAQDFLTVNQAQNSQTQFAVAAGTAQAITAVFVPNLIVLIDGMEVKVRALLANTATAPTFSPNALPAHPITKMGGEALAQNDIVGPLHELTLRYNLANTRWELLNPGNALLVNAGSGPAFNATGEAKLPSGLIIKWGYIISLGGVINFPEAFPNALLGCWGNACESGSAGINVSCYPVSAAQMQIAANGGAGVFFLSWFAIGF